MTKRTASGETNGGRSGRPFPWFGLAIWIALPFSASLTGILFPPGPWYDSLNTPPWTPPDWLFGPAWTYLYASMGLAAFLVWRSGGGSRARAALGLFFLQLALNAGWTPLFFGLHAMGWALVEILVLLAAAAATALAFFRVRRAAGMLLLPYLAWLTYAAALNAALWRLNPRGVP
ncbi:MAG: TspO/MBR family protein [Acidobacteriota bacterium]